MQNGVAAMENGMEVPEKLKIQLPCDPAILLLGIFPKELKSGAPRDISTTIFITALLTVAKMWKQSESPLTNKQIKKM